MIEALKERVNRDEMLVRRGNVVTRGQLIAKIRDPSHPPFHFELRRRGEPVNPLLYLENTDHDAQLNGARCKG